MDSQPVNRVLRQLRPATPGADPTDRQLLEAYRDRRDEAAFAELVRRHERAVHYACRQVLSRPADIEDAFQATFLVLIRRAGHIRWEASLGSWLFAVAHRVAVRLALSQRKAPPSRSSMATVTPAEELSWREACATIHEELNRLPDKFRLPLMLCYLQGFSRDEAARHLGWKPGSVKAGLERGREALRGRLEGRGITLSAALLGVLARPIVSDALTAAARLQHVLRGTVSRRAWQLSRTAAPALSPHLGLLAFLLLLGTAACGSALWFTQAAFPEPSQSDAPAKPAAPEQGPDDVLVTGDVVDHLGKPVPRAKLWMGFPKPLRIGMKSAATQVGEADERGHFSVNIHRPPGESGPLNVQLVAHHPTVGCAWLPLDAQGIKAATPIKLTIPENLPFTGRVVDPQGNALSGVEVTCETLGQPKSGDLEDLMVQSIKRGDTQPSYDLNYLWEGQSTFVPPVTTDAGGQFTLHGVGSNRHFILSLRKTGLARGLVNVMNLPGFGAGGTPKHHLTAETFADEFYKREAARGLTVPTKPTVRPFPSGYLIYHGSGETYPLFPGRVVEGRITDQATGQPVPGIGVACNSEYTVSDQDGRYRLQDLTRSPSYYVTTTYDSRYLQMVASVLDRAGDQPIRLDFKARRGAALKGRVIDAKTGRGVRAAIKVIPTPTNPYRTKAGILAETDMTTKDDGTFELIAVPGDVVVTARYLAPQGTSLPNPYLQAEIRPDHGHIIHREYGSLDRVVFQNAVGAPYDLGNAYDLVELDLNSAQTVELVMARGKEVTLKLRDPEGKPVEAGSVCGLSARDQVMSPWSASTLDVVAFSAVEKSRTVYIINADRNLGAHLVVRGDEPGPVEVRLQPLATVSGRLMDAQRPFPDQEMRLTLAPENTSAANPLRADAERRARPLILFGTARTDANGEYVFDHVLPEVRLQVDGPRSDSFMTFPKLFEATPGKKHELGLLGVSRRRPRQ